MGGGLLLGRLLARLVHNKQQDAGGVGGDVAVFDAVLTHTVRWYVVVGSVAIAMTPLVYSAARVLAMKRKAGIMHMVSAVSHSVDYENAGAARSPLSSLISLRSSLFSIARVTLRARRILSAQHATNAEFANVFTSEVVGLYSDVVLHNLLRCFFCDCITHISIFTLCAVLGHLDGFMVGHTAYQAGLVHAPAVCQQLLSLLQRMWLQLRHDGLLCHTLEDVSTPYTFFIFSQSSCRMIERWFPSLGIIHFAAMRCVDPCTYIDPRWRNSNEADGVWRVMTPKGFAVVWCCRALPRLRREAIYSTAVHNDSIMYTTPAGHTRHTEKPGGNMGVVTSSDRVAAGDGRWHRVGVMLGIMSDFVIRTSKTCVVVFTVTSLASRSSFSWLPFKCDGGPRYVALCYAEMISALWLASLFVLRYAVDYSVRHDRVRHM